MLSHYETHSVPLSECRRERLLSKLIIQSTAPTLLREKQTHKVSVFTALQNTITFSLAFWGSATFWLTPVTRKAALQITTQRPHVLREHHHGHHSLKQRGPPLLRRAMAGDLKHSDNG